MPLGVRNDEASYGYNAYSILQTGKDEHGKQYPLVFKAFGDYKLPGYMYSLVPSIKIFGLTNFAIRLPSILAGTLSAICVFLIVLRIPYLTHYAFLAGLLFAASPWSIILSRSAFESNLALLFMLIALYFYVHYEKSKQRNHALLSGIFLGLTWYTYIPYRLITLLLVCCMFLTQRILKNKDSLKMILPIALSLFIITLPLMPSLLTGSGTARFNHVGIFSDDGPTMEVIEARTFCMENFPKFLCYALSNKVVVYGRNMLTSFLESLSPEYLFINGDDKTTYLDAEHFGNIHMYLLPFYIIGGIYLIKRSLKTKNVVAIIIMRQCH